jgi:hypothetical protein
METLAEHGAVLLMAPEIMHSVKKKKKKIIIIKTMTLVMACVIVAVVSLLSYTMSKRLIVILDFLFSKHLQNGFLYTHKD